MAPFLLLLGALNLIFLGFTRHQWARLDKTGRLMLAGAVFLLFPLCWMIAVNIHAMERMKSVEFCNSCHVMEPFVNGIHDLESDAMSAIHYRNNLVPQKKACYDCHTSYSMFGGVHAKLERR